MLSPVGLQFVAGLLDHAKAMTVFGDPTINAYKRFRPYSFAPDRIGWAVDNRGALIRIQGGPGDASTHVENRMSEPAANPYLWLAANIAAGLDGIERGADAAADRGRRPVRRGGGAAAAVARRGGERARRERRSTATAFGDALVDYIVMMKRAEVARYAAVGGDAEARSDWEMREYFEIY